MLEDCTGGPYICIDARGGGVVTDKKQKGGIRVSTRPRARRHLAVHEWIMKTKRVSREILSALHTPLSPLAVRWNPAQLGGEPSMAAYKGSLTWKGERSPASPRDQIAGLGWKWEGAWSMEQQHGSCRTGRARQAMRLPSHPIPSHPRTHGRGRERRASESRGMKEGDEESAQAVFITLLPIWRWMRQARGKAGHHHSAESRVTTHAQGTRPTATRSTGVVAIRVDSDRLFPVGHRHIVRPVTAPV
ncbi:hypothetical protein MPTK1_7g19230 [Marchantia polymorpha subsp. ruderalis]|uniref:Uncharacterized protein n=2 Tax=Marchantia polymorpha TaxID=3197 RepID=A0AAF6C1D4_MARPO|nr:hypothetical protein MARPO_0067s0055 [Marchantia polymorpha]BBN18068.1 hypothetical protein Mp_7g19230 [Marchantia polymorpha subsp. ruderalis]|eukprot:PTQ35966.1 hypothetical protein MARPO_0067s0055 [Marchantia polymorpha]